MKKSELKNIIKECVKEVLFEEGVLSKLVAEVAFGITTAQKVIQEDATPSPVTATAAATDSRAPRGAPNSQRLLETKKKMLKAIGTDSLRGVFEGTEPLPTQGQSNAHGPLANRDSRDAGVDITNLFNLAGEKWNHLK